MMKKLIFSSLLLSTFMLGVYAHADEQNNSQDTEITTESVVKDDNYANELEQAENAGYTEEQFNAIMSIPNLEDVSSNQISSFSMASSMTSDQQKVVNEARKHLGKPYVLGAKGPNSFDCSGLVQYVYKNSVNMTVSAPTTTQEKLGKEVSLSDLQPGDLLFYGSRGATYHVAIYSGNGNMIYAPQPGQKVKEAAVSGYKPDFARRILKEETPYIPIPLIPNDSSIVLKSTGTHFYGGIPISISDREKAYIITGYKDIPEKYGNKRIYSLKGTDRWVYELDIEKQTGDYTYISMGSSIHLKSSAFYYYDGGKITEEDKKNGFILDGVKDIPKKYGSIRAYKVKGSGKWFYESDVLKQTSTFPYISMGKNVKFSEKATNYYDGSKIQDNMKTKTYKLERVKDIKKSSLSIRAYKLEGISNYVLEQDLIAQ